MSKTVSKRKSGRQLANKKSNMVPIMLGIIVVVVAFPAIAFLGYVAMGSNGTTRVRAANPKLGEITIEHMGPNERKPAVLLQGNTRMHFSDTLVVGGIVARDNSVVSSDRSTFK